VMYGKGITNDSVFIERALSSLREFMVFCSRRTLSFAYVLEFSTTRQEKLDVEAKVFYA